MQALERPEGSQPITTLITGGNGFLGRALAAGLRDAGHRPVIADLTLPEHGERLEGVTYTQADIRDLPALLRSAEDNAVDAIAHLAGLVIPVCRKNPVLGAEVNVIGQINVMELARQMGISRLVYTSSLAARPRGTLQSPTNLYGVYKRCGEDIAKVYFLDYGIASVGLRPNVVYGPGRDSGETAAITLAMRAAARGEAYEIPFSSVMCFQHIDEVTDIFIRCLAVQPEQPVVSDLTTDARSTDEVIAAIRKVVPDARITAAPSFRPAPEEMDNAPLQALLGDWQSLSLEEGTRRTIDAFRRAATG
jgi:UDP-glucuronate 4-epimerase